jgi:hypothetical protein
MWMLASTRYTELLSQFGASVARLGPSFAQKRRSLRMTYARRRSVQRQSLSVRFY